MKIVINLLKSLVGIIIVGEEKGKRMADESCYFDGRYLRGAGV